MNFKTFVRTAILLSSWTLCATGGSSATEIFIHHPGLNKASLAAVKKVVVRGELFFHLLAPATFPSYNDLSGPIDRWNFGFQNHFPITKTTTLAAQLVTHDDGSKRTKFDWHFHLRQEIIPHLVAVIGHDSDHDSDHTSRFQGKPYYLNRNYLGIGIPFEGRCYYVEPFTWFFHNRNQRTFLDMSGNLIRQEFGVRASVWAEEGISAHLQICFQTDRLFSLGQSFLGELIVRMKVRPWLELSLGGSLWTDMKMSLSGNKQHFHKLIWGIAIPF